jgi:hypothetical protein
LRGILKRKFHRNNTISAGKVFEPVVFKMHEATKNFKTSQIQTESATLCTKKKATLGDCLLDK